MSNESAASSSSDEVKCVEEQKCALIAIAKKLEFILPHEVTFLVPGLLLTATISLIALYTGARLQYVTPLIVAMGVGVLFRNAFILPEVYKAGIVFSMRRVLRFGVGLLGVRITFNKIAALGWEGITIAIVPLMLTYFATVYFGKFLKNDESQTMLIATGTSICGASAIMTAGAVTRARSDNIMVAVSSITVFGTLSMIVFPLLFQSGILGFDTKEYGIWAGAAVHEVAQVIAAAFGGGNESGEWGTMVKLTRVAALVPFAIILSYFAQRGMIKSEGGAAKGEVKFPFFLFGFLGMVFLNSNNFFTPQAVHWIEVFSAFLLTMSMAAMGLETDFSRLIKIGFKPLFLSIFSTLFITLLSFVLVKILL
jgi:uncharacterized integral membrane protein (TIGR00698 family)